MEEKLSAIEMKLVVLEGKIDATLKAAESTRKIIFWTGIVSISLIVLPAIGLFFAIPAFLSAFSGQTLNIDALQGF